MIYEPKEIANTFNTHFSTISCKLISQLPASAANYQDYLGSSYPSSMFFYPTCPQEIKRIISTLKPKLSSGWDGIFFYLFSFLLTINLKLIKVHVEIKIVNKEAATKRSTLLHAQRQL